MFVTGTDVKVKIFTTTYPQDLEGMVQPWIDSTPKKIVINMQLSSAGSGNSLLVVYKEQ